MFAGIGLTKSANSASVLDLGDVGQPSNYGIGFRGSEFPGKPDAVDKHDGEDGAAEHCDVHGQRQRAVSALELPMPTSLSNNVIDAGA